MFVGLIGDFLLTVLNGMLQERTREGMLLVSRAVVEHFQGERDSDDQELARIVRRAFLEAQRDLCTQCLNAYRSQLLTHQREWLKTRKRLLDRDIATMPDLPEVEPPVNVDEAAELGLLAGGPDKAEEQLKERFLRSALADTTEEEVPDVFRRLLADQLVQQMRRRFEKGLREHPNAEHSFRFRLLGRVEQVVSAMAGRETQVHHPGENPPALAPAAAGAAGGGNGESRPIFAVPYQQNRLFTGREELLTQIHASWQTAPPVQAIVGLAGLGKTQLALEYAYRYRQEYQAVLWVQATDQTTLEAEFGALFDALGLQRQGQAGRERSGEQVREWLTQHDRWLLVVDGALDAAMVEPCLPKVIPGHVLVTSRATEWGNLANVLEIAPWSAEESVQFLQKRTRQEDPAAAAELGQAMGGMPLALEQAGAYIRKTGIAITHYLERFQSEQGTPRSLREEHDSAVSAAWTMAFDSIKEEAGRQGELMLDTVVGLMRGIAFLAPHVIPLDLISQSPQELPAPWDNIVRDADRLQQAVAMLRRYSLIRGEAGSLEAHRLVQRTVRAELSEEERRNWVDVTVRLMAALFRCNVHDSDTWDPCHRFLPHALAAARRAQTLQVAEQEAGALLNRVGYYLKLRAQLEAARQVLSSALKMNRAAYGPTHPETALSHRYLGDTLGVLARHEEAYRHLEQALAIDKATFGPVHITVGEDLNQLGMALCRLEKYEEARARLLESMAVAEATGQTPLKAKVLHYMAVVLERMGKDNWNLAQENYEKALVIGTNLYGQDDPFVATRRNNLGQLLRKMGRPAEALAQERQALVVHLTQYGRFHREVAADLNSIAMALWDLGRRQEATDYFTWALDVAAAVLGEQHPEVEQIRDNLRYMAEEEGRGPAA